MSLFSGVAAITKNVQIGSSALSLVSLGQALITPNDDLPEGIAGFKLDIVESDDLTLATQITDHYSEDNVALQDHIAIAPTVYTLTGLVGELFIEKTQAEEFGQAVLDRLQPLGVLSPAMSANAQRAFEAAKQAKQAADAAISTFNSLKDAISGSQPELNRQQKAYDYFEKLINGRALVSVQTPWKTFDNMAIESVNFNQDAASEDKSRVTVTVKQMRFVATETNAGTLFGRIDAQKAAEVNKGKQSGKSIGASLLDSAVDTLGQ